MIGISLEDLGIETDAAFARPETQEDEGYPKEYDFALDLHIHGGSWRQMRDALYPIAAAAFRGREKPLMGFTLHWAGREGGDTEEPIKAALTGLRYDQDFHEALETNLQDWAESQADPEAIRRAMTVAAGSTHGDFLLGLAENEHAPHDVLSELVQEPAARHGLLFNAAAGPQMVREVYGLIKDEPWAAALVARASATLPAYVIEALAKGDYEGEEIPDRLMGRDDLTEQALLDLIGKCGVYDIGSNPACTDRVRAEIDRLQPSGGTLRPKERENAAKELKKIRSAIKSGRTGAIERRRGAELDLLRAVRRNPDIDLFDVYKILGADDF